MEDVNSFGILFSRFENKETKRNDGMSEPAVAPVETLQQVVTSPYRKKLIQEVQRKLQKALDLPSQRGDVLHQLFTDIALEVDCRAKARLYSEENFESPRAKDREHPLCFYEVLAEHYARIPGDGDAALALFVKLWSQSLAAQIFTLLFYEWLFEVPTEDSDGYLRYSTAFVEGASAIFWIDMQSNVQRFFSLYHYTLNEVIMNPQRHLRLSTQARCELILMLSRFFFFYEPAARLQDFFVHFPPFPSNLGPADVFVIELADQLQKVKVEPALLHYLKQAEVLKGKWPLLRLPALISGLIVLLEDIEKHSKIYFWLNLNTFNSKGRLPLPALDPVGGYLVDE
ncbi:unnamed protein product [Calypogeia fissa]